MADPPTLIELAPFDRPAPGSFISALAALGDEARSRGWRCEIVVPEGARELDWIARLEAAGMRVHFSLPPTRRERTRWLQAVASDRQGPTILHSHFNSWDVPAALVASPREGRHAWWHVHTILRPGPLAFCRNLSKFAWFGRRLSGVLCPTEALAHELSSRGLRNRLIHVVPNGIDPSLFPLATPEMRVESRRRLGIPEDAEVLLHFGWNWRIKGGQLFIEAVSRLVEGGGGRVLALAQGEGDRALEVARQLGVSDHVRPIGSVSSVAGLFAASDVFLALSEREGGNPYAVLESISCGTPVVASDIPGHAEIVRDRPPSRLVPRRPEAVAAAVREVLDRPEDVREADALAGHEQVARDFSAAAMAVRMLDLFERRLRKSVP